MWAILVMSQVYSKLFSFYLQGFRKRAALVLYDPKSKVGEKLGMLVWEVIAKYLKKPLRILDSVQFTGRNTKPQRQ